MRIIFDALRPFIRAVVKHPYVVVLVAVLLTAGSIGLARNLTVDTDIANLVPDDYNTVQALERLRQTVGGERADVAVGIVSPSFEANREFAEDLIPRALSLERGGHDYPYLSSVNYRRDTDFLERNALYFASNAELDLVEEFLLEAKEDARLEANPFFDGAIFDDEEAEDPVVDELEEIYRSLVGTEYPISDDSTTMVLRFQPADVQTDLAFIEDVYRDLQVLIDEMDPTSYHPAMETTLAGRLLRQEAEVQAVTNDIVSSFAAGVSAVLVFVVLYFLYKSYRAQAGRQVSARVAFTQLLRAPILVLVIALPLLMSLAWTGGVAYLLFGQLNLMTSTLGLVLFGLGIDFGIHFYARYTEERAGGLSVVDAAEKTFTSTGQAIATGAFTTAAGLYVLMVADFRGFSEFGAIAGTGVLFAFIAMTVIMPALLSIFERTRLLRFSEGVLVNPSEEYKARRFRGARPVVIGSAIAVLSALALLPRVEFEYDFSVLEPEYEAYSERTEIIGRVSDQQRPGRRNPGYIVLDNTDEVESVVSALRQRKEENPASTIMVVESLQERFPLEQDGRMQKIERIEYIRDLLDDRYLREESSDRLDRVRRAAQTEEPIPLEQVPDFLRNRFTTQDGEVGKFVMVYPSVGLSDGRNSMAFLEEVGTIETPNGTVHHAGSTSLVAAEMLKLLRAEAPWMILGVFLAVALLMYLNFGAIRWALVALIPLVVGILWMLLLMVLFGVSVNFYNMVVLPAILGIGNDAGVHLVHRYREEGAGSIWTVLRSTGEHVSMGTITTMIGFGGLLLSFHPGLNSMGVLAAIGLGTTLLAALTFLPGLLQWLEDADKGAPPEASNGAARADDVTSKAPTTQ